MDAEEDDENVKQLNECAALYLSLQAHPFTRARSLPVPDLLCCSEISHLLNHQP
jgi:hypothetical protein